MTATLITALTFAVAVDTSASVASVEERFATWVARGERSIAALRAALGPELEADNGRDLGFGLRRITLDGDGQSLSVDAVVLEGRVLYVHANEAGGQLKREFDRAAFLRHIERTTGARNLEVPKNLASAYERLFFPYDELMIGWNCGWGRKPAAGRVDIELLSRAGRFDLIANILLGGNPEGRVYAARALDGRELSREVRSAVEQVFASPLRIRHCSSDIIRASPAADLRRR